MKKIAWLLVVVLIATMMPMNVGVGAVQAANTVLADNTVITSEHIPDTTLLNFIKNWVGKNPEETVTYKELQDISDLSCDVEATKELGWEPIESLEGIGLLKNLYSLSVSGHNITDLTALEDLQNLRSLWAYDNQITIMADLSDRSMSCCYLDRNHLTLEELQTKYPSNMAYMINSTYANQLPVAPAVTASSKYYEVLDKSGNSYYPVAISVAGLRKHRTYTVTSIIVDDVDYKDFFTIDISENYMSPQDMLVNISVNGGKHFTLSEKHTLKCEITDEYGESFAFEQDFILEPMQDAYVIDVEQPQYFSCTGVRQTGIKLDYKQFMTRDSSVKVQKVELVDQKGQVLGAITNGIQHYTPWDLVDYRYTDDKMQRVCYQALWKMVDSSSNVCQTMFSYSGNLNINYYNDIEPGFYNLVFTLSDGVTYTYRNAYEAVTRPIVYGVMDAIDAQGYENDAIMTDQTGDYVSIYVYGWNINKDTVKPVFYNEDNEVISGDVAAVETGKWGAFFRIEKQASAEDGNWSRFFSLRETNDWDIPLSTNSWEATNRAGYKQFDIKLEVEGGAIEEKVGLERHEIYYQYYDQRDKTYTVYFAQEADVDTTHRPTLSFQKYDYGTQDYAAFVTVGNGTFTEQTNALTGQKEICAVFGLGDEQINMLKENAYDSYYAVDYRTADGEDVTFRSDYSYTTTLGDYHVEDVPTRGRIGGYYGAIFYLPYWIGGVYTIEGNGENSYYLTESDVQALGTGKYAYADAYEGVTPENSSFANRSWQYYFWEEGEPPKAPTGTPALKATKNGELWKLSWNSISGATRYRVHLKYGNIDIPYRTISDTYLDEKPERLAMIFREFFEECYKNPNESKMEIYVEPIAEKDDDFACGSASNVLTVAGIRKSLTVHTHTNETKITKANASKKTNGYNKTVCKGCGKTIKTNATYYYPKTVTVSTVTYNGKSQTPKVVVKDSKGKTISSSHYTVSKVKSVGTQTVTITFKSTSKYYTGKLTAKCKVIPPKTTMKSVSAGSKKLTAKWTKKTAGVTGYQIQYSTSKTFKSAKTVTIKKDTTTSTTIKKLKGKKKYYVRVRTYAKVSGKYYYSGWSSAKSKTTKK